MNKYVFLRINERFKNFFRGNLESFLELYYRREENVFYKEQFRLFLTKNSRKDISNYLVKSLGVREELNVISNKMVLENKYKENDEILEMYDNYILLTTDNKNSPFKRYLLDYDNDFIIIDLNNSKIERLSLVN